MKQFLKNGNPFFLMVVTLFFLHIMVYIPDGYQIKLFGFEYKVKKLDMLQDVLPDVQQEQQPQSGVDAKTVNPYAASLFSVVNSMVADKESANMPEAPQAAAKQKIENPGSLKNFFAAVKLAGSKRVRIAHYGDSAIEGDNISADLRKNLQTKYGGNGVGIIGVTPLDVQFRTTTNVKFSTDWKTSSALSANSEKLPLGINGYIYQASANSWVRYEASGRYNARSFSSARVLYTSDKNFSIKYSFDDKTEMTAELKASKSPAEYVLDAKAKVKSVKITVVNPSKTYFYGVSLEDGNGLYLDNFALRGNSGVALREMDMNTLKSFNKLLNYRLVILNFGLNIAGADQKDYGWYESAMEKIVNQYKEAFPEASFLVVSVQDKSMKKGTQFVTEPGVPKLVEAQKKIALKTGVAYFNLYEAMGGMNSMSDFVSQGLAEKDYTHMKLTGAKKLADLITDALLEAGK